MKRKFLEDLGLDKEVINKIMDENGNDIEAEKTKAKEVTDNLQSQLDTVNESLKKFEGVDVEQLKSEISTLQTTLQSKEAEFQDQLADRDFNQQLEAAISSVGARNAKAVKALLDIDALKASKNQEADIKAAIEACQKENDYLFGSDEPIKNPVAETNSNVPLEDANLSALKSAMGITD